MGNPDAEPDACAHGGLAFFNDGGDLIAVVRLDLAGLHQVANQFVNGLPAVGGQHLSNDLRRTEDVTQVHTDFVAAAAFRLNSTGFTRANSASLAEGARDRMLRRLNRKERRERRESRKEERGLALAAGSLLQPGKLAPLKPRLFPSVHGHDKTECHRRFAELAHTIP